MLPYFIKTEGKMNTLLKLFTTFFKIGAFTFGGGYAMIPLIQREAVEKNNWVSDDDILEIIAIAESTPGPIAINSATFIGYKVAGNFGAAMATLGVALPSFLIISVISYILKEFQDNKTVAYAFFGIRAGVVALILKAIVTMFKKTEKNTVGVIIMLLAFILSAFTDVSVLFVIILCGVSGILTSFLRERGLKK